MIFFCILYLVISIVYLVISIDQCLGYCMYYCLCNIAVFYPIKDLFVLDFRLDLQNELEISTILITQKTCLLFWFQFIFYISNIGYFYQNAPKIPIKDQSGSVRTYSLKTFGEKFWQHYSHKHICLLWKLPRKTRFFKLFQ